MNLKLLLFTLSLLFFSVGCKKLNIKKELRIDIGSQFQNDFVIIKLDNDIVFSDNVSTNSTTGFSKILTFKHPIGKCSISVSVNDVEKLDEFKHEKNRYIYISFDKISSEITISYPTKKYVYD